MRDLQDFFESLSERELKRWDELLDETEFNSREFDEIHDTLKIIYETEMDVIFPDDDVFKEKIFKRFRLAFGLYLNVVNGYVTIKEGKRLELKDEYNKEIFIITEIGEERARKIRNKEI